LSDVFFAEGEEEVARVGDIFEAFYGGVFDYDLEKCIGVNKNASEKGRDPP